MINTKHKESKFIFDADTMTVVFGKPPRKHGQLSKGETLLGTKMELVGFKTDTPNCYNREVLPYVAYWGWSK